MTRDELEQPAPDSARAAPGPLVFLRVRALWLSPLILGAIVTSLMALTYIGALKDPSAHLHGLRVAVVNEDVGAMSPTGRVDFGRQISNALTRSPAVTSRLSVATLDRRSANREMGNAEVYLSVVIPPSFSRDLLEPDLDTGPTAARSATGAGAANLQLVTNPRLGSAGVGLATGVLTPALAAVSNNISDDLDASRSNTSGRSDAAIGPNRDPIQITSVQYHPLPSNSALGLSPFYLALLATMCGFLGATLVNSAVDSGLGYATTETGSTWRQRAPVPISRWHTLLTKWAIAAVVPPVLVAVVLLIAVGVLGLNAPGVGYLWALMSLGALAVAAGTLTLFAALGALGQLLALILFVYLALASAGATVPSQALPEPFATISVVDPLRRVFEGVRSIVFFGGHATDGWPQAVVVLIIELALWLALGALVTRWYDRRGRDRMSPELIDYVARSVAAYPKRPRLERRQHGGDDDVER